MKRWLIFILSCPSIAIASQGGGINLTPDPRALLRSTASVTASWTFFDTITFLQPITVPSCIGCGGGAITPGASFYLWNTNSLQPGATLYVGSATIQGNAIVYSSLTVMGIYTSTGDMQVNRATFTQVGFGNGIVGAPSIYFGQTSRRTGLYGTPNDEIDFGVLGSQVANMQFNSWNIASGISVRTADGSDAAPPYSFTSNGNTGMSRDGGGALVFSVSSLGLMRVVPGPPGTVGIGRPIGIHRATLHVSSSNVNQAMFAVSSGSLPTLFQIDGDSTAVRNKLSVSSPLIVAMIPGSMNDVTVSSFTASFSTWSTYQVAVTTTGNLTFNGSSPTITTCGATPNGACIGCTNDAGTISVGGGVPTACTLNFAPQQPWKNLPANPTCVANDNNAAIAVAITAVSNTAVTFGASAALGGGLIFYHCFGVRD